jgi:hypothetical protein
VPPRNRFRPNVLRLEDRVTPSLTYAYDPNSSTVTLTQTTPTVSGPLVLTVNGDTMDFTDADGSGAVGLSAGANLTINLAGGNIPTGAVITFSAPLTGNLTVNLNSGAKLATSLAGTVFGNVTINGGSDNQDVSFFDGFSVGGNLSVNLGTGNDTLFPGVINVGGNATFTGINNNIVLLPGTSVGGNLMVSPDNVQNVNDVLVVQPNAVVGGFVNFTGSAGASDLVQIQGVVGGGVTFNALSNSVTSLVDQLQIVGGTVGGSVTYNAGSGNEGFLSMACVIGGSVSLNWTGVGTMKTADIGGVIGGGSVSYSGGTATVGQVVMYHAISNASVSARYGSQASNTTKTFVLGPPPMTTLRSLYVDFGTGGKKTFINGYGAKPPFPITIVNL